MSADTRLISSLINRLGIRLPCNTPRSLESLESDPIIRQTVGALIDLSKFRLGHIANQLVLMLENVSKTTSVHTEESVPFDILQSQLFLLKVLNACLRQYWANHLEGQEENGAELPADDNAENPTRESTRLVDPPPLDDSLARYIVNILIRFLHQMAMQDADHSFTGSGSTLSSRENLLRQGIADLAAGSIFTSRLPDARGPAADPSPFPTSTQKQSLTAFPVFSSYAPVLTRPSPHSSYSFHHQTHPSSSRAYQELMQEICRATAGILFVISASNWNVIFLKLKTKLAYLSSTSDEWPETVELRLLECSALNSRRLSAVLQELCNGFLHLKKGIQLTLASILRSSIWHWIQTYPTEFIALCQSGKRLDGGPELLFDMCSGLADNPKRKAIFWPLQTVLLILCPDLLMGAAMNEARNKKALFLDNLKKSLKFGRLSDVATACFVDICKACTYVPKSDSIALRHIVPEIEHELRDRLFDPQRPFANAETGTVDGALMMDCLVAMFRLNPRHALKALVPVCLDDKSPTVFHLVLVRACLVIAEEGLGSGLSWNPSIENMYRSIAAPFRCLFLEQLNRERSSNAMTGHTSANMGDGTSSSSKKGPMSASAEKKQRKVAMEDAHERQEILISLLTLYATDPGLVVAEGATGGPRVDDNASIIAGITTCLKDSNLIIRQLAADVIRKLHSEKYVPLWGPSEHMMETFWKISSNAILSLARQILDSKERIESQKQMLELLKDLLVLRNEFIALHLEVAHQGADARERLAASIALEIVLLILLCSANADIPSMAVACFGHLCREAQITGEADDAQHSQLTIVENLHVYQELSFGGGTLVMGRKALQKRIRKLLRMMSKDTPGNLAGWEEAYKRWKFLTPAVNRRPDESRDAIPETSTKKSAGTSGSSGAFYEKLRGSGTKTQVIGFPRGEVDDNMIAEWQNYTGFLAALGGCCLSADANAEHVSNVSSTSTLVSGNTNSSVETSKRRSVPQPYDPTHMVDKFVAEMVDLLVSDNVVVREVVKEILGTDLSPGLYALLFHHLETAVARFFDSDRSAICSDRNTLFIEHAISVLKLLLDRMGDPFDNLFAVDFGGLVHLFAKYLNKLGTNTLALRIKVKFCQMCEVLMQRKENVTLRQEIRLRNQLLEIIVEWTSDFSLKPATRMTSVSNANISKLQRDLDQACLKTTVALLDKLPLQPSESFHDADLAQLKSNLFYKYFTFFLKLLNRCKVFESMDTEQASAMKNPEMQLYLSKSKDNIKDMSSLKEYTVLALSNLLSANVDTGLKYSLSMAYHEDTRTRTAFMQVLTNILNSGTEFDTLAENVMSDRYEKLVELIVEDDLTVTLAMCETCPVTDMDDLAQTLLACFESNGQVMTLLKAVIKSEVANTANENELFRMTSMATRLLSGFAKSFGEEYIRSILQPVMQELVSRPVEACQFELDPSKLVAEEEIEKNYQNVKEITQIILDAIFNSTDKIPKSFREVCHYILKAVDSNFPEAKYTSVGNFIFLRFFCPNIVSPNEGLIKPGMTMTKELRRGILLATKTIQNLANNVLFGAKETYMIPLNDFLTANIYPLRSFLHEISSTSPSSEHNETATAVRTLNDTDYAKLHRLIYANQERIAKALAVDRRGDANSKKTFERLSTLLAHLGRPNEEPRREFSAVTTYNASTASQLYTEFMRRNAHRSVEPIASKNIFYEGPPSKSGRPVLYYIAGKVKSQTVDYELLIYYILKLLEPMRGKSFDLCFDMSQFDVENEIPNQWINQLVQLIPSDLVDNITTVYIFNVNFNLRRYVKRLSRPLSHKVLKRIVFATTIAELSDYIAPNDILLPNTTVALEAENSTVFFPVTKITPYRTMVPVTIKVGVQHIQIMTVRRTEVFGGLNAVLTDVYHISSIDDAVIVSHGQHDDNEFIIKYDGGKSAISFSSIRRDAIVGAIKFSKNRFEMSKPTNITERVIRPNDVPGRLLNMALLNLGSDDPSLRLAAYNLLYALSLTFRFDVGNQLLDAKDLCIPANNAAFVIRISEKLAKTEPTLTLEFLSESFVGLEKSSKGLQHYCLEYMTPWLANLTTGGHQSDNSSDDHLAKTKDIIQLLIGMTVEHGDMHASIQSQIWQSIGRNDDILDLVLDSFIHYATQAGIGSHEAETIADTIATLSSITVRGKLISRLRKVLAQTSFKPTRSLTEHPSWPEIATLIRFNVMLSFNSFNEVNSPEDTAVHYLPELLHIVSLLVAAGPTLIRSSLHGLVVNIVQSLCTAFSLEEEKVKKLHMILSEVSDPKYRLLFGLTKHNINAFTISTDTLTDAADPLSLSSLETIIYLMMDTISYGAPSVHIANVWRARWMGLVTSTAFQFNPAIQPRAFIILGCLAEEEVDDDLLYQILVALRGALAIFHESDPSLIVSIMMCLKNIVSNLPTDSRYLQQLFWLAMALVQIGHVMIFPTAVELLKSVLRALENAGLFNEQSMVDVLLRARAPIKDIADKLDQFCGVSFETHFSFAVATLLLKGLKMSSMSNATWDLLEVFLETESKHDSDQEFRLDITNQAVSARKLGYLAALMQFAAKNAVMGHILQIAGIYDVDVDSAEGSGKYIAIFEKLDIPDNATALLLVSLLVTMLNNAESEPERLFLYGILAEAAVDVPEVFSLVYDLILPKMNQVIANSTTIPIMDSVKSILYTACAEPAFSSQQTAKKTQRAYLEELGFSGMNDCSNFDMESCARNAILTSELVERIIL